MKYFVEKDSIVRQIWGKSDTVLFIFAGSAAEFALNKAVDWLYFTGRLPADPLGRLFSTVGYARRIVFAKYDEALKTIDGITSIHKSVENKRGKTIPDWAYRDVLPYFRRAENRQEGGNEYRGGQGKLQTRYGSLSNPLHAAWLAAAREAGYPHTDDVNGFQQEGFGRMDMTVYK